MKNKKSIANNIVKGCLPVTASLIPLTFVPGAAQAMITIVVSATAELNFGALTAGTGGTVTISPAGARSFTGGVTLIPGAGVESAASLSISGSTGVLIDVNLTNPVFTIDDAGAGAPMNVGAFNINGGGSNVSVTLPTNTVTFPMGGTLTIPAAQAGGLYTGVYMVMAEYQ